MSELGDYLRKARNKRFESSKSTDSNRNHELSSL